MYYRVLTLVFSVLFLPAYVSALRASPPEQENRGATSGGEAREHSGQPSQELEVGSPEYIAFFIPSKSPYARHTACANPGCPGYNRMGYLRWDRSEPETVRCNACGTRYPNEDYPQDSYLEIEGDRHFYHRDPEGNYHFFSGAVRAHRAHAALGDARNALRAHMRTGDKAQAHRARNVFVAFARTYPTWFKARAILGDPPLFDEIPGQWGGGRLQHYFADYNLTGHLLGIYEDLSESGVLTGEDEKIILRLFEDHVGELIYPYYKYLRAQANTAPRMLLSFLQVARVFPKITIPHQVHAHFFGEERDLDREEIAWDAIYGPHGLETFLANGFHPDGFWHEGSLAYHYMVLRSLAPLLREARLWLDPEQAPYLEGGEKQETAPPELSGGLIERVMVAPSLLTFPDGMLLPLADTRKRTEGSFISIMEKTLGEFVPPEGLSVPTESSFHDGVGVAALRSGRTPDATAAFLIYGPRGGGHSHYDQLSLTYFSLGHELVTDIGYPDSADPIRHTWWNRTAAHNTIVVDGRNQRESTGRLEAFAASPQFQVVQARSTEAYPDLEDYRRTLVLVGDSEDEERPRYLVDVFHVIGGELHDLVFHAQSDPDEPQEELSVQGLKLTPQSEPGRTLLDLTPGASPRVMGYEHIDELESGEATGGWEATWHTGGRKDLNLRLIRLVEPGEKEEVFAGQAPGHRMGGSPPVDFGKKMRWLGARRAAVNPGKSDRKAVERAAGKDSETPFRSTFASIVEAFSSDASQVRNARHLDVSAPADSGAVAIAIEHDFGSDIVVVARRPDVIEVPEIDLLLKGRIAAVSLDPEGNPIRALIVDGETLRVRGAEIWTVMPSAVQTLTEIHQGVTESPFDDKPLIVDVRGEFLEDLAGEVMLIEHQSGAASAFRIRDNQRLVNARTRFTLDRSGRTGMGYVEHISADGRTIFANTGRFPDNASIIVGDEWRSLRSVSYHHRNHPYRYSLELDVALAEPEKYLGERFFVTDFAAGDACVIPMSRYWTRD